MTRTIQILIGCGILVLLILLVVLASTKEGFASEEDPSATKANEITAFMTTASETLCPAYKGILEDKQRDYEGSAAEKLEKAMIATAKEAGGTLFPCPPPDDPLAVPADIEDRLNRTLPYIQTQLNTALTTIKESLDCKGALKTTEGFWSTVLDHLAPVTESFQDVCTSQQLSQKQADAKEQAAKAAVQSCIAPQDVSPQLALQLLTQRSDALNRVMSKEETPILFAQIKTATQELQSLKNRAQSGMIQSSCPT